MPKSKKSDLDTSAGKQQLNNVVIECLDAGCTTYILIDKDGTRRLVVQPKKVCSLDNVPDDFQEQYARIVSISKETTYATKHLFDNVEVGKELKL